jgi:DNA-directed RNA polymerase subunit RPC12/RpoP
MFDPSDPWLYELCFPGAISGETEISCPACSAVLTVTVDDPLGSQSYQCPECEARFRVNWGA